MHASSPRSPHGAVVGSLCSRPSVAPNGDGIRTDQRAAGLEPERVARERTAGLAALDCGERPGELGLEPRREIAGRGLLVADPPGDRPALAAVGLGPEVRDARRRQQDGGHGQDPDPGTRPGHAH